MRLGGWQVNARLIDHHWPPRWAGPWLGLRHHVTGGFLFDLHLQRHREPGAYQAGFAVVKSSPKHRVLITHNWISPAYHRHLDRLALERRAAKARTLDGIPHLTLTTIGPREGVGGEGVATHPREQAHAPNGPETRARPGGPIR